MKLRTGGRVKDFRGLVKGLAECLYELGQVPKRFTNLNMEEPVATLIERIRAYGYVATAMTKALEIRDGTERWEKQLAHLESIIVDLNGQLQEARSQQRMMQ